MRRSKRSENALIRHRKEVTGVFLRIQQIMQERQELCIQAGVMLDEKTRQKGLFWRYLDDVRTATLFPKTDSEGYITSKTKAETAEAEAKFYACVDKIKELSREIFQKQKKCKQLYDEYLELL